MKLICAEYQGRDEMTVSVVGDNALLRNNTDFYFPAFTRSLSCVPQLVLKACKLGKGVSERFAGRYYQEVGAGVRFYADSLAEDLKKRGLPWGVSASFDDSAALSDMMGYTGGVLTYALLVNEREVFSGKSTDLPVSIDRFISLASGYYMIKIGDFFFCGNPFRYSGLRIDDRLRLYLGDRCLLDFSIR